MPREKRYRLNPDEAKLYKAAVFDLSGASAKQVLYGIIQLLSLNAHLDIKHFQEMMDDAIRLTEARKPNTTSMNEKEKTQEGSG